MKLTIRRLFRFKCLIQNPYFPWGHCSLWMQMDFNKFTDGSRCKDKPGKNIFSNFQSREHSDTIFPSLFKIKGHFNKLQLYFRMLFFKFFKLVSNEHAPGSDRGFIKTYFHDSLPLNMNIWSTRPESGVKKVRMWVLKDWSGGIANHFIKNLSLNPACVKKLLQGL